jgi:hypothetical protein
VVEFEYVEFEAVVKFEYVLMLLFLGLCYLVGPA